MKKLLNVPVLLTPDEVELLRFYLAMDLRHRDESMAMLVHYAEKYPMTRKPVAQALPGLRLVKGGAA